VASASFAQQNPKILLLLQVGYHILLYFVPIYKDHQEKDIYALMHLSPHCHHARQAGGTKSFLFEN